MNYDQNRNSRFPKNKLSPRFQDLVPRITIAFAMLATMVGSASAQEIIFSDPLESGDAWVVNNGPQGLGTTEAIFGFDYSTIGIPPAPGSPNTLGLRLAANIPPLDEDVTTTGTFTGVSVSPANQEFTGNYQVKFHLWQNFPGPLGAGGTGSTQLSGGGIGTSGNRAQWPGSSTYDSLFFMASGDGGTGTDYRVYPAANNASPTNGYYLAGTGTSAVNNTDPFYSGFGGVSAPAAQTALYSVQTGTVSQGALGFAWREVTITKEGNFVTWNIDGKDIAKVDISSIAARFGGNNILLNYSDINVGQTTQAEAPLLFGLFDNVRVIKLPDSDTVSARLQDAAGTVTETIGETGVATLELFRPSNQAIADLRVNLNITGTAVQGADATTGDYLLRTNGVIVPLTNSFIIPAGQTNLFVEIAANNDTLSEFDETIGFSLAPGSYVINPPNGGTVTLTDNDAASAAVSAVVYRQAYEGVTNDFMRFTIKRGGDISGALPAITVNLAYSGSASSNVDYVAIPSFDLPEGILLADVDIKPIHDTLLEGTETVILTVAPGVGYVPGDGSPFAPGAIGTLIDDELPTETILFSDNFNTDTLNNYTLLHGAADPSLLDYSVRLMDYAAEAGIPPAPHSTNDTTGVLIAVNIVDPAQAAAINLYPNGQAFSGDYALRFDMFLMQPDSSGTSEHAIFGLNHDGTHTNWFRSGGAAAGQSYDGFWAQILTDGSGSGGDYALNSAPAVGTGGTSPTVRASASAATFANIFHNPPWTPFDGPGAPGNLPSGDPANSTYSWAQVELSQVTNVITLKVNNTTILSYTNATGTNSGNVMIGFNDAFDSVGGNTAGFVIYDNVRVVRLGSAPAAEVRISTTTIVGSNLQIDFTAGASDTTVNFKLAASTAVTGPYTDDNTATVTQVSPGTFRVSAPIQAGNQFFQIHRLP